MSLALYIEHQSSLRKVICLRRKFKQHHPDPQVSAWNMQSHQRLPGRGQPDCWPRFLGKSCRGSSIGGSTIIVGEPLSWCSSRRRPYYIWAMASTTTPQNRISMVKDWRDPKIALNTLLRLNPCTDFPHPRSDFPHASPNQECQGTSQRVSLNNLTQKKAV